MTVFVQKFKDGQTTRYEVFRRSTAPEDSSLAVENTRQAAIATAGQLSQQNEAIREMPDQDSFGIIRDGDIAPGPGDNPGDDPAGGFFDSPERFTPAQNENQAPLGSVDDSLDNLLGEPSSNNGDEPGLEETLSTLLGGGQDQKPKQGPVPADSDKKVLGEDDVQAGPIEATQNVFDKAFGEPDSDEGGVVQDAINNPKDLADKAADRFFINR